MGLPLLPRRRFRRNAACLAPPCWAPPPARHWPAWAREGVDVGRESKFSKLVSAEQVEHAASQQYLQMQQQAAQQKALAPDNHPQLIRLARDRATHHSAHL